MQFKLLIVLACLFAPLNALVIRQPSLLESDHSNQSIAKRGFFSSVAEYGRGIVGITKTVAPKAPDAVVVSKVPQKTNLEKDLWKQTYDMNGYRLKIVKLEGKIKKIETSLLRNEGNPEMAYANSISRNILVGEKADLELYKSAFAKSNEQISKLKDLVEIEKQSKAVPVAASF